MKVQQTVRLLVAVLGVAALSACGGGKKKAEVSESKRKEATLHVSEAQFALSVRDYARAEPLLAKAAELAPDTGDYWLILGQTRMRLGQKDAARTAYKRALAAFEDDAKEKKTEPQPVLQQITTLALLGRIDDAKALIEKLPARFPDNRAIRTYSDGKALDRMMSDPKFKELAL